MDTNNKPGINPQDALADIRATTRKMFTPPKAGNKLESLMNMMDQGVMVYDGLMMGMRFARNIRRLFSRRR